MQSSCNTTPRVTRAALPDTTAYHHHRLPEAARPADLHQLVPVAQRWAGAGALARQPAGAHGTHQVALSVKALGSARKVTAHSS